MIAEIMNWKFEMGRIKNLIKDTMSRNMTVKPSSVVAQSIYDLWPQLCLGMTVMFRDDSYV